MGNGKYTNTYIREKVMKKFIYKWEEVIYTGKIYWNVTAIIFPK